MFWKLFRKKKVRTSFRADFSTDSGMLGIWNNTTFAHIRDYDSWDAALCEDNDILGHVKAGHFVPLKLGDGAFSVDVRIASPDSLSEREKTYLLVQARPYLLKTDGKICVSGIEYVGGELSDKVLTINIAPGNYAVYANLIDWNQEPGAFDTSGAPTARALPDIIVFVTSPLKDGEYRQDLETFLKEDAQR